MNMHPEFKTGFIKVREDKSPDIPPKQDWNKHTYKRGPAEIILAQTGRIGKIAGYDNGISFIDHDSRESYETALKILPQAPTETTTSGGYHQFIRTTAPYPNRSINRNRKEHLCEIRTTRQYVVIAPSRCRNKKGQWGDYELISDIPIPTLTPQQLDDFIAALIPEKKTIPQTPPNITRPTPDSIKDLLQKDPKLADLYRGGDGGFPNDRSAGDMSLAIKLFQAGYNRSQVYDLMNQSNRTKWNTRQKDNYQTQTLDNAEIQATQYANSYDHVINLREV
jgi:hypothetical protein